MNLIKKFRNPCFAIILASLTLFASCSQYDNELLNLNKTENEISNSNKLVNNFTLENYVEKHLQISTDISILLKKENNIDLEFLKSISAELKPEEILGMLKNANIKQSEVISELFIQMYNNNINFVISNPYIKNLRNKEIENMLTIEIDNQFYKADGSSTGSIGYSNTCQEAFDAADAICVRNFAISAAISSIGLLAGGIAGGLGLLAAIAIALECNKTARDNLNECLGN